MFFSKSLLFASAIGVVTQVVGEPATETDLIVTYGQVAIKDGAEVAEDGMTSCLRSLTGQCAIESNRIG